MTEQLEEVVATRRIIAVTGLPGVGKSTLVQRLVSMAQTRTRPVHLLQWDVARLAFDTPALLARFPEVDGFTHPAIVRAVGEWSRRAVLEWYRRRGPTDVLIAECPIVGGRFAELAEPHGDDLEPVLAGDESVFLLPVPSVEVRAAIERRRARTIARPDHAREAGDAAPNVMQVLWAATWREGAAAGVVAAPPNAHLAYDPVVYRTVYLHWLRARHSIVLPMEEVVEPLRSVYEVSDVASELRASREDVAELSARIGR